MLALGSLLLREKGHLLQGHRDVDALLRVEEEAAEGVPEEVKLGLVTPGLEELLGVLKGLQGS